MIDNPENSRKYVTRPVSIQSLTLLFLLPTFFPPNPPTRWSGAVVRSFWWLPLVWSGCPFILAIFFHLSNSNFYYGRLLRKKAASSYNSSLLFYIVVDLADSLCSSTQ